MRKLLSFLMAAAMVLAMAVPAQAAADGIKLADVTVQESELLYIPVSLLSEVTATAVGLTYTYDSAVLEILPEKCSWSRQGTLSDFSKTGPQAVWAVDGAEVLSGDLCVLAFRVLNVNAFQETEVGCSVTVKNGADTVGVFEDSVKILKSCAHQFGDWTDAGEFGHVRKCSVCNAEQLQSHEWDQGTKSPDPENPNVSILTYRCTVCGAQKVSEVPGDGSDPQPSEPDGKDPTEPARRSRLRMHQEYVVLRAGERLQMNVIAEPVELTGQVRWSMENQDTSVASVDSHGMVTAHAVGTAYVVASVTEDGMTLTARCRVDVPETEAHGTEPGEGEEDTLPVIVMGRIQLSTDNLTAEVYSREYASFEILLKLPQNEIQSADTDHGADHNHGVAVESVRFADAETADLFQLMMLDDRRAVVVPTGRAIEQAQANGLRSSYSSQVTVKLAGQEDTVTSGETLTLTVKKSMPKLTAKVPAFNSFYTGQTQDIQVTGGTVTGITLAEAPDWLTLEDNCLKLAEGAPAKKLSGKVRLLVDTEEWAVPAEVKLTVSNSYKQPGLKLSASTVTLADRAGGSGGVSLQLRCSSSKDTLAALKVTGISVSGNDSFAVENFRAADGSFTFKGLEGFQAGKLELAVSFRDTDSVVLLPLKVKKEAVKLKLSKTGISLNASVQDSAAVSVTATPSDYILELDEENIRLADTRGNTLADPGILDISAEGTRITVATNEKTPAKGTCRLYVSAGGSKEVYTTVTIAEKVPSVSFKAKGTLDLSFPDNAVTITPSFKNYAGSDYTVRSWSVTEKKGGTVLNPNAKEYFRLEQEGDALLLNWKEGISSGNSYEFVLALSLPDGTELVNKVSVTAKRTGVKLKLGQTKVSLNKQVNDAAAVEVSCRTAGYAFEAPLMELRDSSGKILLDSGMELTNNRKLRVTWADGKVHIQPGAEAAYGERYQLRLMADANSPASKLTVNILSQSKSKVSLSLRAKGSVDVVRQGSAITVTPTYKNCGSGENWQEQLLVYSSADNYREPVEGLFHIHRLDGSYTLTREGALDPNLRYKVRMVSTNAGVEISSSLISISVKMGSAKVAMEASGTTLFAKDGKDRTELVFTSADETLNQVKRIAIRDSKYRDHFEIIEYGSGEFAIGFKNSKADSSITGKTVNLKLDIYLEGNDTDKANATAKLQLKVLK